MKKILFIVMFLILISSTSASIGLNLDLVSYWNMDGNSLDSKRDYNGSDNAITYTTGKLGQAAYCDGLTSRIDLGNTPDIDSFTWGFWAKNNGTPLNASNVVLSRWPGNDDERRLLNYGQNNNMLNVFLADGTQSVAHSVTPNTWYYIIIKQDNNLLEVFFNGTSTFNTSNVVASPTADTTLCDFTTTGFSFKGWIDEVGLWTRALNDSEIIELYNNYEGKTYPFVDSTVNFTVYNFSNKQIVNNSNTTFTLIGETITYIETTTTGLSLFPVFSDSYRTSITNPFFDTTTLYLSTFNDTQLNIDVYLETDTLSRTFIVQDSFGVPVADATVSFYRNVNGSFITSAQEVSDFSGRATVNLHNDVVYRMVVIASGYDTFTGNVQPIESEYTVTLTESALSPFTSLYGSLAWVVNYTENTDNIYSTYLISSAVGGLEYFGVNVSYNGVEYSQNTTGSPGGGQINFNITPLAFDNQTFITFNYWFKVSGSGVVEWQEFYNLNPYNNTNITFTGGLFDDIVSLSPTSALRGLIGALIVVLFIVVLGVTSKSGMVGLLGGVLGLGVNWYFSLWPTSLIVVSLVVALVFAVVDGVGGGR